MTDAWSITDGYWDVDGEWHPTPPETQDALRSAMGGGDLDVPPDPDPMWFVRAGEQHSLWNACDVILEDGAVLHSVWDLPPDLPLGYHELRPLDGTHQHLARRHARPVPGARAGLGLGGAAVRHALGAELGHR